MYKLSEKPVLTGNPFVEVQGVLRLTDNTFFPCAPVNSDYQQFKKDLAAGIELQDSTGALITGEALTTFVQGLK